MNVRPIVRFRRNDQHDAQVDQKREITSGILTVRRCVTNKFDGYNGTYLSYQIRQKETSVICFSLVDFKGQEKVGRTKEQEEIVIVVSPVPPLVN